MHFLEQVGLAIVIIVFVTLSARAFHTRSFPKHPLELLVIGVAVAVALFIVSGSVFKRTEHFETGTDMITQLLTLIGVQNATNNTQNAMTLVDNINLMNSNYNEDFSLLESGLRLYYSSFSKKSYPRNGPLWYNICSFFATPNPNAELSFDETHLKFNNDAVFTKETGFSLNQFKITGPKCHLVDVNANSSFSIFTTMRFNSFPTKTADGVPRRTVDITSENEIYESVNVFEVFKLYANTFNNTGISLFIDDDITAKDALNYEIKIGVEYGTYPVFMASQASSTSPSDTILINKNTIYMLVLIKDNNRIFLYMYPDVGNLSSVSANRVNLVNATINNDIEVLLSNKQMVINRNKNLQGNIYNFGIYNKALNDTELQQLYNHVKTELQKTNKVLVDLALQINQLQSKIDEAKACPYSPMVCNSCADIKDWTDISNIIMNAKSDCLTAVDVFCQNNPTHNLCTCWNPNNLASKTMQCQNYVNIFKGTQSVTPDNVSGDTLEIIKKNYNLCSCKDVNVLTSYIKEQVDNIKPRAQVQKPMVLTTDYKVDPNDLASYESIPVNNYYDKNMAVTNPTDSKFLLTNPFDMGTRTHDQQSSSLSFLDKLFGA